MHKKELLAISNVLQIKFNQLICGFVESNKWAKNTHEVSALCSNHCQLPTALPVFFSFLLLDVAVTHRFQHTCNKSAITSPIYTYTPAFHPLIARWSFHHAQCQFRLYTFLETFSLFTLFTSPLCSPALHLTWPPSSHCPHALTFWRND